MFANVSGQCITVGSFEFDSKTYPYFELLQMGDDMPSEVVRVMGSGPKVGEKCENLPCQLSVNDRGKVKVKYLKQDKPKK